MGFLLYAAVPSLGKAGNLALFVGAFCVIVSMYGGGFATIPAYLADMFGPQMVGAIHGRLLTAWATAGVLGPVLVNYIREFQIARGVPNAQVYDVTMYILAGFLVLGFVCNLLVRPVADKYFMTDEELAKEKQLAHDRILPAADGKFTGNTRHCHQPAGRCRRVGGGWPPFGLRVMEYRSKSGGAVPALTLSKRG